MPLDVKFTYPAPVPKPRPVMAKLEPMVTINLKNNTVTGSYREWFENPAGGAPIPGNTTSPFQVILTDAQIQQMLGIVAPSALDQGILVKDSTVSVG